jgi:hypothetical protein
VWRYGSEWRWSARVLVMVRSIALRMYSWSYSGFAMLVPCHVCGVLLPLNEKTTSSGYELYVCGSRDLLRGYASCSVYV